jgi:hypothetical protein
MIIIIITTIVIHKKGISKQYPETIVCKGLNTTQHQGLTHPGYTKTCYKRTASYPEKILIYIIPKKHKPIPKYSKLSV